MLKNEFYIIDNHVKTNRSKETINTDIIPIINAIDALKASLF